MVVDMQTAVSQVVVVEVEVEVLVADKQQQQAMQAQGFEPYAMEWWHFSHPEQRSAATPLERIRANLKPFFTS